LRPYFDSGIITKWYVPEPNTADALALRDRFKPPVWLTSLHRIELTAAWRLKVFRKEIPAFTITGVLADFHADVSAGIFVTPPVKDGEVARIAEDLADQYCALLGTRSLDILHVAWALAAESSHFVTGDERQARLAEAVRLPVVRLQPPPLK
jgi:predicted nucleic acid-binding protein